MPNHLKSDQLEDSLNGEPQDDELAALTETIGYEYDIFCLSYFMLVSQLMTWLLAINWK